MDFPYGGDPVYRVSLLDNNDAVPSPRVVKLAVPSPRVVKLAVPSPRVVKLAVAFQLSGPGCHLGSRLGQVLVDVQLVYTSSRPGRQGGPLGVGEDLGGVDLVQTTPGLHHRLFVRVGGKLDEYRPVSVQPASSHFSHAVAFVDGVVWECDTNGLGDRLDNVVCTTPFKENISIHLK